MQLIIEVGNTNIKIAIFKEDEIIQEWKLTSFDCIIFDEIVKFPIQKGIISGSGNLDNLWIQSFLKTDYKWIILENEHIAIHSSYDKNSKISGYIMLARDTSGKLHKIFTFKTNPSKNQISGAIRWVLENRKDLNLV
jgi:hypothetical protein